MERRSLFQHPEIAVIPGRLWPSFQTDSLAELGIIEARGCTGLTLHAGDELSRDSDTVVQSVVMTLLGEIGEPLEGRKCVIERRTGLQIKKHSRQSGVPGRQQVADIAAGLEGRFEVSDRADDVVSPMIDE